MRDIRDEINTLRDKLQEGSITLEQFNTRLDAMMNAFAAEYEAADQRYEAMQLAINSTCPGTTSPPLVLGIGAVLGGLLVLLATKL